MSQERLKLKTKAFVSGALIETVERKIRGGGSTYIDETFTTNQSYNADGEKVKRTTIDYTYSSQTGTTNEIKIEYYVNSSVTDKAITVLDSNGAKQSTNVYFGEAVLATQKV